ncbi:MAG TPA: hypothetical protein VGI97_14785 [Gemmatimonadaceae bacterium]|jgi:hypothetical protein
MSQTNLSGNFAHPQDASSIIVVPALDSVLVGLNQTAGNDAFEVDLEQLDPSTGDMGVRKLVGYAANQAVTSVVNGGSVPIKVRLRAAALNDSSANNHTPNTLSYTLANDIPASAEIRHFGYGAKVGATAGWIVVHADDVSKIATLPKNCTAATLIVPLFGFKRGDRLVGAHLLGSLQAGNNNNTNVTLDIRMMTSGANGAANSSLLGTGANLTVAANTALGQSNTKTYGFDHASAAGETYYAVITATTANDNNCTAEIEGVALQIVPS